MVYSGDILMQNRQFRLSSLSMAKYKELIYGVGVIIEIVMIPTVPMLFDVIAVMKLSTSQANTKNMSKKYIPLTI